MATPSEEPDLEPSAGNGTPCAEAAASSRPRLLKTLVLTGLATASLVGAAEVCWSYWLAGFNELWRAELPTTLAHLVQFVLGAMLTDTLPACLGAVLAGLLALAMRSVFGWPTGARESRFLVRALLAAGATVYLYLGWLCLFVLPPRARGSSAYWLILAAGVILGALLSFALFGVLAVLERRWRRSAGGWAWAGALALVLAASLPAYARYRGSAHRRPQIAVSGPGTAGANVMLITLDTLRADQLGCYGNDRVKTPHLDALASDGLLFQHAISQAPTTGPSHASIMTSLYPFAHDAQNGKPIKLGLVTIADVLRANGYRTVAFVSSTTTRSINSGLQQGFDVYADSLVPWSQLFSRDDLQQLILFHVAGLARHSQIPGSVVTDRALDWLAHRTDQRFFLWLHYFDPHSPYGSPAPYQGMYEGVLPRDVPMAQERERYAEDVTYVDNQVGRIIDELEKRRLYDQTVIIVVSDHGEGFGEQHAKFTDREHGRTLYETTQRVPLIIKPAGRHHLGRRIREQVELTDLAPTICRLLDIDPPTQFVGRPLDELIEGRPYSHFGRYAYSFTSVGVQPLGENGGKFVYHRQYAVHSPRWKYLAIPQIGYAELYNLLEDPGETINVLEEHPKLGAEFKEHVGRFWQPGDLPAQDSAPRLAPALVRQLRALGYLGGTDEEPQNATDSPDGR